MIKTSLDYITIEDALEFIKTHDLTLPRLNKLGDYFDGKHAILERVIEDASKPNNKIISNLPNFAVGIRTGYFSGEPLTITSEAEAETDVLDGILEYNDFQDVNADLDEISAIYGSANLVLWLDEEGFIRMTPQKPTDSFVIYDNTIKNEPVGAVMRHYYVDSNDQQRVHITLYNKDMIRYYDGEDRSPILYAEETNFFGDIPMIEFVENNSRKGSFEDAISIVDAIESILSSCINEVEYFDNAYLEVSGMSVEAEDIQDMKNNRVLVTDEGGKVGFVTKNINDTYIQNMLNRLTNDFHKLTATPNLTDENFSSNASGVAMSYKLFGLEKQINKKESKWRKSLQRTIELIVNILNMRGNNIDYRNYKITFTRSLPQNVAEIAQMVTSLNGIVSQETLLSMLPFVEKPQDELERVQAEKEAAFDTFQFPLEDSTPTDDEE